jgi:zinc protease
MTPERIHADMKRLLTGTGPRLMLLTPPAVEGGTEKIDAALAAAQAAAPAKRPADRTVGFDSLPALGPSGTEVSRQRIEDLDVTIVRLANGSTLTFKQTDFDKGAVSTVLRYGNGVAGLPPDRPSLGGFAGVVRQTGFADLDLDGVERLLAGRRIGLNFGMGEDSFVLSGTTNAEDLADQLRVFALKLAHPRWDDGMFNRSKASWLESYDLAFASASARAGRESGAVTHPNDARWLPLEKVALAKVTPQDFRTFYEPLLGAGPIEAIIVGDVELDKAVTAMAATIGALPSRPTAGPVQAVSPPRPEPKPRMFTHSGDPIQAYAMIGWTTAGRAAPIRDRRALSVAAAMLRTRLFDRMREEQGYTYSPGVSSSASETFPDWGVFVAEAQVRPESVDGFLRIAREQVADLAMRPATPEEFARALNPAVSGIERNLKTNGYWVGRMAEWPSRPELIEQTRTHLSDYKALTPEAVRAAIAAYVADEGDWSMLVLPEKAKANGD